MGRSQRTKGKVGEREAVNVVCKGMWRLPDAHRNQQSKGEWCPDINATVPIHVEVKRYKSFAVLRHLEQAERDSGGKVPECVLFREDGKTDWVFMCRASKLEEIGDAIFGQDNGANTSQQSAAAGADSGPRNGRDVDRSEDTGSGQCDEST